MPQHIDHTRLVRYGLVRKTHGHKGNIVLSLENEGMLDLEPDFLFIEREGIPVPFRVIEMTGTKDHLITTLSRLSSSEEADLLRGAKVYVTQELYDTQVVIEDLEELSLYHLLGYAIKHTSGEHIGELSGIDESTANILLILTSPEGEYIYIPFVEEWIVDIDHTKKIMTIDCPTEILTLNNKE